MKNKGWSVLGQAPHDFLREIIVLVLGILIAFWLDNWWAGRMETAQESELIEALYKEFINSKEELEESATILRKQIEVSQEILYFTTLEYQQLDPQRCDTILGYVMSIPDFDPFFGVVQEILNSGQLNILKSDQLRVLLAAWPSKLTRIRVVEEKWGRRATSTILPYMYKNMSFVNMDSRPSSFSEGNIQFRSEKDNRQIFQTLEFQNIVDDQIWNFKYLMQEYSELERDMNEILDVLLMLIEQKKITIHHTGDLDL